MYLEWLLNCLLSAKHNTITQRDTTAVGTQKEHALTLQHSHERSHITGAHMAGNTAQALVAHG